MKSRPWQPRNLERHVENGEGGEQLDQRRMFGVQAEIGVLPGLVSGEDVIIFIPGDGFLANGEGHLREEDGEQGDDSEHNEGGPFRGGFGHRFSPRPFILHGRVGTSV